MIKDIDDIYPLTVIKDRYSGVYSGGKYLAFNMDFDTIHGGIIADDCTCAEVWEDWWRPVGRGDTMQEALDDLIRVLNEKDEKSNS